MKRSRSSFRAFARVRLVVVFAIAVVVALVLSATALMKGKGGQNRNIKQTPSTPLERVDAEYRSLFVDETKVRANARELSDQAASEDGELHSYALPKVKPAIFDGDVRNLPQVPQPERERIEFEEPLSAKKSLPEAQRPQQQEPNVPMAPMPNPIQNFAGLGRLDMATNGSGTIGAGTPPDPNGDVGPNHYIQAVNDGFGIFNKTGTLLASFTENSLFSAGPTGTLCDTNSFGDPVVLYDSLADRWILTNFAFTGNGTVGPFYQCIAASKTGDPVSGGWNLYAIRTDTGLSGQPPVNAINDYPKFGVWTDCLYYSANAFNSAGSYIGGEFGSFSRVDMYSGAALTASLGFSASTSDFFTMLPSHLSAPANGLPPAGRLNFFVQESLTAFNFRVRTFTPGTNCGGTGTLSAATTVSQTSYTPAGTDVAQPNTTNLLDSLSDRMMQKNQYRNIGGAESLWVTHTVRSGSLDAPQWAQINVSGGVIAASPVQQQIYTPDTILNRWMPSIAADKDGNVAVGYSTSNGSSPNFPSIAYSGRLAGDTLNQLPQTETQLIAGSGSQTGTCGGAPCHRWGDYSSMSVDPSDSCTFWYSTEYYTSQSDGSNNPPIWSTRIGSFTFAQPAQCSPLASTPTVPAAPTGLTFSGVTAIAMTLNWTDNATNEDGYVIYRSTDNTNFSFAAITAANATSQTVSGLTPSTTYFWKVFAFTKGALSTPALTGNQATNAPGMVTCNGAGGNWSLNATWAGGVVPTSSDNVTIGSGCTITIDTAAVALNVTINSGGTLQFESTTARTLTTSADVTIDSGGVFQSATTGTQTGHTLSITGNLTNNGTLDFSTNTNTAGAGITFTGATNNTFGGTGGTTDIRTLTINKGASNASILELNPTNFTVQGINSAVPVFLTLTNGTLKVSGTFSFSSIMFTPAAYTIGATTGFWLNNPNFTVTGQSGSPTMNGLLRISQGTFNVGTGSGNSMTPGSGSAITIEGGTMNVTGRLSATVGSGITGINYTQTGGTLTVSTVGNASSSNPSFGFESATNFIMSGGTIVLQNHSTAATPLDYSMFGTFTVTGGTLQVGNASTPVSQSFIVRGGAPSFVIDNSTTGRSAVINGANALTVFGNVTVNNGTTLSQTSTGSVVVNGNSNQIGNVVNNGTISNSSATGSNRFQFFSTFGAQTYSGAGTFGSAATPYAGVGISNSNGVTLSAPMTVTRVNLFTGAVTGAGNLTFGNGGASTSIVQISQAGSAVNGGSFDVSPTYNTGTGGHTVLYLQEPSMRTTGFEIPPTRSILTFTEDNTSNVTLAGGDLTLTSSGTAATLTNGRFITGTNTVILSSGTATITRTNGYIDGNFRKTYSAAGSKTYEVGTANGYSPVTVNATAGTFPAAFTIKAVQGAQPMVNASTSIQRYWTLTNSTITSADLTFQYLAGDVMGTEANYKVIRVSGANAVSFPSSTVNTGAHTATLTGATGFSDWTVGEPVGPTAANAIVSGHLQDTDGNPVAGASVTMGGAVNRLIVTDAEGNYHFDNVETNGFYTVTPSHPNFTFSPESRSFSLLGMHTDASFTASANAVQVNAIDSAVYFVRQHYLDFLNREPDEAGFNFWTNNILACGNDGSCIEQKRMDTSAAYLLSIEFQETGFEVYRMYKTAFGNLPGTPVPVRFSEFLPDTRKLGQGVIVNQAGWEQVLEANKQAFANDFVSRSRFTSLYGGKTNAQFVDSLSQNAGIVLSSSEREALLTALTSGTKTRAQVLRAVAENAQLAQQEFNRAFVLMEYFGYLRRDPNSRPDTNFDGYNFWLNKLETFGGSYQNAEMVKAFLTSIEYRSRFRL